MRAEPPVAAVEPLAGLLAVHVVDPVPEVGQERHRVQVLPDEVARVEVQPERRPVAHRLQRPPGGPEVVGDLAGVHLVREPHALGVEHVQDRVPAPRRSPRSPPRSSPAGTGGNMATVCQIDEPVNPTTVCTPNAAAARAVSASSAAARCRTPSGSPSPQIRAGRMRLVPHVDRVVADRLADQVVGDGPAAQPVLAQQGVPPGEVAVLAQRPVHLEVVTPAGQLEAVVAPLLASRQTSSRGRSAHCPVNSVNGRDIIGSGWFSLRRFWLLNLSGRQTGVHRLSAAALAQTASQHVLDLEAVRERGLRVGALGDRGDQVADLVGERVLPAQHVPRRPPGGQVRVARLGDQDAAEPCGRGVLRGVAELQLVEPLQVEGQAATRPVDLDPQRVLPAGGEPGRLERWPAPRIRAGR